MALLTPTGQDGAIDKLRERPIIAETGVEEPLMSQGYRVDFKLTTALSGPSADRFVFPANDLAASLHRPAGHFANTAQSTPAPRQAANDEAAQVDVVAADRHGGEHAAEAQGKVENPVTDFGIQELASTWKFAEWHHVPLL